MKDHIHDPMLWIFDFDGTLSEIVPDRTKAMLNAKCKQLLFDLVQNPLNHVAVLSSRTLDELNPRVPVRGIFLGGGCGTEWRIPGRHRITLGGDGEERLKTQRERIMEPLRQIASLPGIELEDKKWSVALHTRHALTSDLNELLRRLDRLQHASDIKIHRAIQIVEVRLLPEINRRSASGRSANSSGFPPKAADSSTPVTMQTIPSPCNGSHPSAARR